MAAALRTPARPPTKNATALRRHVIAPRPLRCGVCPAAPSLRSLQHEAISGQSIVADSFTACALMLSCMGLGSAFMAAVRQQRQAAIDAVPKIWVPRHGQMFIRPSYVQELCKQWPSFARTWFMQVPAPGAKVPQLHAWMHPSWGAAGGAVVGLLLSLLWLQSRSHSLAVLWFRGRSRSRDKTTGADNSSSSSAGQQLTRRGDDGARQGNTGGGGGGKPPKRTGWMRAAWATLLRLIAGVVWSGAAARRWAGRVKKWRVLTLLAAFLAEHLPARYAARTGSKAAVAGPHLLRSGARIVGALPAAGGTTASWAGTSPEARSTEGALSDEELEMLASSSISGDAAGPLSGLDEALAFKLQWNPELKHAWHSLSGAPDITPPAALLRISAPRFLFVDGTVLSADDASIKEAAKSSSVPCTLRHIKLLSSEQHNGALYQLAADFCSLAAEFADATGIPLQAVLVEFDFTDDVADVA